MGNNLFVATTGENTINKVTTGHEVQATAFNQW